MKRLKNQQSFIAETSSVLAALIKKYLGSLDAAALKDIFLITALLTIFIDLAAFSPFVNYKLSLKIICTTVVINSLLIFLLLIRFKKTGFNRPPKLADYSSFIIDNSIILLILSIYIAVKIYYLDVMLRWDGAYYFCQLLDGIKNFKFDLTSFLNSFNINGHPSMGYLFFMSFGQFIDFGNHQLLNAQNLILSALAVFSFYKILLKLYPDKKTENCLLAAILAFNPLFFGVSLTFNLDFPLIVFWLLSVCALLYNRFILFSFFATILVFSKENGALTYFSFIFYLLILFLIKTIKGRKNNQEINLCTETILQLKGKLWFLITPAILFLSYLLYRKGQLWNGGSIYWNNTGLHNFGLNWKVLLTNSSQIFILNFSWVMSLIIIAFLLKSFFCRRKYSFAGKELIESFLFTFIINILFTLLYITWSNPRYVLMPLFFLIFFSCFALLNISGKRSVRVFILSFILAISVLQTFKTCDPLSRLVFTTFNFGKHQMLNIGPGDGMVYNSEFTIIDKLINKTNQEIKISDSTNIILSDLNDNGWIAHFNGVSPFTNIYIDKVTLKRTFKKTNTFQPKVYDIWEINQDNRPADAYYLFMSWHGNVTAELKYLSNYYKISEKRVIDSNGYCFRIYKLRNL